MLSLLCTLVLCSASFAKQMHYLYRLAQPRLFYFSYRNGVVVLGLGGSGGWCRAEQGEGNIRRRWCVRQTMREALLAVLKRKQEGASFQKPVYSEMRIKIRDSLFFFSS